MDARSWAPPPCWYSPSRPIVDCTVESTERTTWRSTSRGCASDAASTAATVTPDTLRPTTSNLSLTMAPVEGSGALGWSATVPVSSANLSRRGTCHLHSLVVWPKTAVPESPAHASLGTATIDSGIGKVTSTFSPCPSATVMVSVNLQNPSSNWKCGTSLIGGVMDAMTERSTLKLQSSMTCWLSGRNRITCSVRKPCCSTRGCSLHSSSRKSLSSHMESWRCFSMCVSAVMWQSSSQEVISPVSETSMSKSSTISRSTSSLVTVMLDFGLGALLVS
mmetsp:Transcript_56555/g.134396  ORF Transcript_56555/g.134396 Transcript_56555/m.134396 type:complete len:277 (-) Transcript_56555:635-1465(-)